MGWSRKLQWLRVSPFILLLTFGVLGGGKQQAHALKAGEMEAPVLRGYITAVHLPDGFDMNDCHVVLSTQTSVGYIGDKSTVNVTPLRQRLGLGAYVQVVGDYDALHKTAKARIIYLRNEQKMARTGTGLILSVVSTGPEPVFRADGYLIRIKSKSKVLSDSFVALAKSNVTANTTLHYKGKIGADGVLEASKANFSQIEYIPGEISNSQNSKASDSAAHSNGGVLRDSASAEDKAHSWRAIPADDSLQKRATRIGTSLVPGHLREQAGIGRTKIDYRFIVIDDEKMRGGYAISNKHVILVSKQAIERQENDSQMAAILAEGLAQTLQYHKVETGPAVSVALGSALSGILVFTSPLTLIGLATEAVPSWNEGVNIRDNPIEDERDRIAVGLMADAGYDPSQAPEAWRLLVHQHSDKNLQSLPYPLRSGYLFNVIATQYKTHTTPLSAGLQ